MARLVKRKVIEETYEVPVDEDEFDGTDEAENDDVEAELDDDAAEADEDDEDEEPSPRAVAGRRARSR